VVRERIVRMSATTRNLIKKKILVRKRRKRRIHLSTDQQKANLIKLCIQNFSRYAQGKGKFYEEMQNLYKDTR
jgi:hypothetical protein